MSHQRVLAIQLFFVLIHLKAVEMNFECCLAPGSVSWNSLQGRDKSSPAQGRGKLNMICTAGPSIVNAQLDG